MQTDFITANVSIFIFRLLLLLCSKTSSFCVTVILTLVKKPQRFAILVKPFLAG